MSDSFMELTVEQALEVTNTLDRLQSERVIHRWIPPCRGDGTYLIIWSPYEPEPGLQG